MLRRSCWHTLQNKSRNFSMTNQIKHPIPVIVFYMASHIPKKEIYIHIAVGFVFSSSSISFFPHGCLSQNSPDLGSLNSKTNPFTHPNTYTHSRQHQHKIKSKVCFRQSLLRMDFSPLFSISPENFIFHHFMLFFLDLGCFAPSR